MTAYPSDGSDSYAQWVRRAVGDARASRGRLVTLFDSSVPEPVDLLTDTVSRAFAAPVTSRYTSAFSGGNPFVVDHLARRYGVDRGQVLCTTGATGALSLIYRALVPRGERILVETPGFDLFTDIAADHGIMVDSFVRAAPDFSIDVDAIAAALRSDTRLVVLSNLHNPSGAVADHATLLALARLAEARGVLVLVDEVYGDYADAAARPCDAASLSPNFISVSSLTKIYGLSTLRCGWIVAAPDVIGPIREFGEKFEFGVSNLSHAVAALVLESSATFDAYSAVIVATTRPIIAAQFARWQDDGLIAGEVPPYGCIAFPRLVGIDDTAGFADWLSQRCGVIVAPGEYFGAPGHVRIGFAQAPADLEFALAALGEGLRAWHAARMPVTAAR